MVLANGVMVKDAIKKIFALAGIDLTKNMKYDRLTRAVIQRVLKPGSNCIDIGCHKGEILELFLKQSPQGKHFAFEPIPEMYDALKKKFPSENIFFFSCALSDETGRTTFNHVRNAPAYSGISQRKYAVQNPDIEIIDVELSKLDDKIPADCKIDLIKIDVEGGEFGVLKGAVNTITRNKPYIIFECGIGASDYYGTTPEELFDFITTRLHLKISLLDTFLKNDKSLPKNEFVNIYQGKKDHYFIAFP